MYQIWIVKPVHLFRAKESLLIQVINCEYIQGSSHLSLDQYYFSSVVWVVEGGQVKVEIIDNNQGIARTQSPTNKNYALELPTFGAIVGVSQTEVQWDGLILEERPSWLRFTSVPGKYVVWRRQVELSLSELQKHMPR